jgi:hypothetical protein
MGEGGSTRGVSGASSPNAVEALRCDVFSAWTRWATLNDTVCRAVDDRGRSLAYARFVDRLFRDPTSVFDREGGQALLRILRPPENMRLARIHESVPTTDEVYLVTDAVSGDRVGVVQKPWLRGIVRERWVLRGADWSETARLEQTSVFWALVRTFVTSLPSRFAFYRDGRRLGALRGSWYLARRKYRVDLRADCARELDPRLVMALVIVLLAQ